jgi:hypothetical protein
MAALAELFIKQETLETLLKGVKAKGLKGISITVSINDDTNEYGQNVSSFVSQTKEEREEKKTKYYTGNGKVYWTDGKIKIAQKVEPAQELPTPAQKSFDDISQELPF